MEAAANVIHHEFGVYVYYEDTDFSGFVYHANYLKFFERGREHLIGIDYLKNLFHTGVHFVVSKLSVDYRRPARHGDHLTIKSTCNFSRSPVMTFKQRAFLGEQELVSAEITVVTLNQENRPTRLPEQVFNDFLAKAVGCG